MSSLDETVATESVELAEIMGTPAFASDLLIAEYRTLRDEILKKMDHRTSLVICSATVSSAVLGFGIERQSPPLLLVSPVVSLLLGIFILFQNVQIRVLSEHLRERIEEPASRQVGRLTGWHQAMGDPKGGTRRLLLLPYQFPLVLITITPAVVALPMALSTIGSAVGTTVPVLIVVVSLLAIYFAQLTWHRDAI